VFNVCPGCGLYREDKHVDVDKQVAVCPECGHEHKFSQLPLLVITGASGTGKSTVMLRMAQGAAPDFVCLDSDILWCDAFNKPDDDYIQYRNTWLRVVKNIAQSGRPVALFGSSTPGQFEQCVERRYIGPIHYLALTCEDDELERRLKARPGWRKSGDHDVVTRMKQFNRWLRENAASTGMTVLDTTGVEIDHTVNATIRWMRDLVGAGEGKK
jgi:hypothetical protein